MATTTFEIFTVVVTLTVSITLVYGGDYIPDRTCATFISKNEFGDEYKFNLLDFHQSYDLFPVHRLHEVTTRRPVPNVSVFVSVGCKLQVCRQQYFSGECYNVVNGNENETLEYPISNKILDIQSAKCTCQRNCSCHDITIPKDLSENPILGRGYFKGGCSTCDSEYVALRTCDSAPVWKNKLESIILRSGCTLNIYSEPHFNGENRLIPGSVFKDSIEVPSYKISCSDEDFGEPTKPLNSSFPKRITLPSAKDEFQEMLKSKKTLKEYPEFVKAAKSFDIKRRSHRTASVIIIGTHQASRSGFPQCQDGPTNKIGECRIPISLDHLGLSTELHVITVPIAEYDLMPVLLEYISTHEELQSNRPNIVILYHELENDYLNVNSPTLQVKLQALLALEGRILANINGNFVVVIDAKKKKLVASDAKHYYSMFVPLIQVGIEPEWTRNGSFQRLCMAWTTDSDSQTYFVNGNAKLFSGEFWPRNLDTCIYDRAINNDGLGVEIFKALFRDNTTPYRSIKQFNETAVDDSKLERNSAALCSLPSKESSEVSEELSEKPKGKFKGAGRALEGLSNPGTTNDLAYWKELSVLRNDFLGFVGRLKSGLFKLLETI